MAKRRANVDEKTGEYIPAGNKGKFEPWMCQVLIDTLAKGDSVAQACLNMGISKSTHSKWLYEHEEYREAAEFADTAYEAYHQRTMKAGAEGQIKNFNATAQCAIMNNTVPGWKSDKSGGTEINIGQINHIDHLTDDELEKKIRALSKQINLNLEDKS